jgi:hypothetical protein
MAEYTYDLVQMNGMWGCRLCANLVQLVVQNNTRLSDVLNACLHTLVSTHNTL